VIKSQSPREEAAEDIGEGVGEHAGHETPAVMRQEPEQDRIHHRDVDRLISIVMFPYLLPQITQFVTGMRAGSEEFRRARRPFLRAFAERLTA
jgi:hypothetical protein